VDLYFRTRGLNWGGGISKDGPEEACKPPSAEIICKSYLYSMYIFLER